jgi:dissimilatory sulfite reductase (desulfoviridin) alpha/beta subunit
MKRTATKKGHYLDLTVKMNTSPGPASKAHFIIKITQIFKMYGLRKMRTSQNTQIERLTLIKFKGFQKNKILLLRINIVIQWIGLKNPIKLNMFLKKLILSTLHNITVIKLQALDLT